MNQQNQFETNSPSIQSIITENSAVAESLSDLPLTGEQAEETKGGGGRGVATPQINLIGSVRFD